MPMYDLKVIVEYNYEVEADNAEEAEKLGWEYEEYGFPEVYSIEVDEQYEEEDEDEDESDD
jgi:hypothetical protein